MKTPRKKTDKENFADNYLVIMANELKAVIDDPEKFSKALKVCEKTFRNMKGDLAVIRDDMKDVYMRGKRDWENYADNSPDYIAIIGLDNTFIRVNMTLAKSLKLHPREIVGKKWSEITYCKPYFQVLFKQLEFLSDLKHRSFDVYDAASGKTFAVVLTPYLDENGRPAGSSMQARDKTEEKRFEDSLKSSHEIIQRARDVVFTANPKGFIKSVSPAVEILTGYSQEEVIGRHFIKFVHPAKSAEMQKILHERRIFFEKEAYKPASARSNESLHLEFPLLTKPDETGAVRLKHVEQVIQPAYHENTLTGFQAIWRDVTERKKSLEKLEKSEELFRSLVETMNEGLMTFDADCHVEYYNPALREMLGLGEKEIINVLQSRLVSPKSLDKLIITLNGFQKGNKEPVSCELTFISKKGGEIETKVSLCPRYDKSGKYFSTIMVMTDISDIKEIERRLKVARREAEMADRAKSDFLAGMSHEIRTPLNAIVGMTELLSKTELDDKQRRWLNICKSSSANLLELIDDILDFSKIEAGKVELENIDFSLHDLIDGVMEVFIPEARDKGIGLFKRVRPEVPDYCKGDPVRIRQILVNFVSNAVKFTEKGNITLDVDLVVGGMEKKLLYFKVVDTGVGIEQEQLKRIFDEFIQGDSSTTRKHGGSGLGLAISRRLSTLMNGTIGAESEPGVGSMFYFSMEYRKGKRVERRLQGVPCLNPMRVLVVEDNESNKLVLRTILENAGHAVTCASDGKAALDRSESETFDIILMDVHMPLMDGFEATQEIRKTNAVIPIIALTADAFSETHESCLNAGMNDFVTKPINTDKLFIAMGKVAPDFIREMAGATSSGCTQPLPVKRETDDPDYFNYSELKGRIGGKAEAVAKIIDNFIEHDGEELLLGIKRALSGNDFMGVKSLAHRLKGAAGNLSLENLRSCAEKLEKTAEAGIIEPIHPFFQELNKCYFKTIEAIKRTMSTVCPGKKDEA